MSANWHFLHTLHSTYTYKHKNEFRLQYTIVSLHRTKDIQKDEIGLHKDINIHKHKYISNHVHALGEVINPVEFLHGDPLILPRHAHTTDSAEHMVGSTSGHVCVAAHDTRRSICSYSNFCDLALECFLLRGNIPISRAQPPLINMQ